MSASYVQVPADSVGKKVDAFLLDTSQVRQSVVLGDKDTSANTVNIGSDGLLPVKLRQGLDYDTGAGTINVDMVGIALAGSGAIVGVSSSNPLPVSLASGFATSAKQDSIITLLNGGLPAALAANGGLKIEGVASGTAVPISSSTLATTAKQDTGNTSLSSIDGKTPSLGQAVSGSSVPVVLPAAQITTLTPPAAITGFALDATLGTTNTEIGGLTETAPASDTASSGLNGRLQRIAQRLTTLIGSTLAVSGTVTANIGTSGSLALESGGNLAATAGALGATSGAKVITDAAGTIQQYLRGLIYQSITAGAFLVTATIAAGTNLIGRVSGSLETSTIYNATTALTPKFAKIAVSSSGANTIIAAVTSKKLRVLSYNIMANAAVNAKWQSHVAPTDLTGLKYMAANGGICAPFNPVGWFETVAGEALDLNLSGAQAVGGEVVYIEV